VALAEADEFEWVCVLDLDATGVSDLTDAKAADPLATDVAAVPELFRG
jgi:hypothetical protein